MSPSILHRHSAPGRARGCDPLAGASQTPGRGATSYLGPANAGRGTLTAAVLALVVAACGGAGSTGPVVTPTAPGESVAAGSPAPTVAVSACPSSATSAAQLGDLARSGPASGTWVGMNLDWGAQTVADVTGLLAHPPADVVSFVSFPLTPDDETNLDAAAGQARDAGALLVVTLEPWGGLATVTDPVAADLAARLARYGSEGVPTIVRFAHEMNGTWYPWGQDPAAYVATFRRVADGVHAGAPTAAMLWAPNQGDGYPYAGGQYQAAPGSAAAAALDTNGDGAVTAADDPYAPYWPGADSVDWVGMSLYFWGLVYPWGENEIPPAGKFAGLMTGAGTVPDFYAGYAERYSKPLAIVETAAFYRPGGGGAAEADIKSAWLAQVFSPDTRSLFPRLRMVNWFEWRKMETEVNAVVDWRITADPSLRAAFLGSLGDGFVLGPVVTGASCGG
jgi:hypothetical protein